jgi:hypothetical protein
MNAAVKRNNLIVQYTTHIEKISLEDSALEDALNSILIKNKAQLLSILLNGKIIYVKKS